MESRDYIRSIFSLDGKIAVVTGASGAVPFAVARAFLKAGARVAIWSRGIRVPLEESVRQLEKEASAEGRAFGVRVDAGNEDSVREGFQKTIDRFGIPDILLNGAGENQARAPFLRADTAGFLKTLEINLVAGFLVPTRIYASILIEKQHPGSVINIISLTAFRPMSGVWGYSASKAGLLNLTEATARELAPHGIRVNALVPGFVIGDQNRSLLMDDKSGELTERGRAIVLRTPFGRFGTLDELEGAAIFLASERASGFATGISVKVDGGFLTDTV